MPTTDYQIEQFEGQLWEARIEADQCVYCGSDEDTELNPLYDMGDPGDHEDGGGKIPSYLAHNDCEEKGVMKNYPTDPE